MRPMCDSVSLFCLLSLSCFLLLIFVLVHVSCFLFLFLLFFSALDCLSLACLACSPSPLPIWSGSLPSEFCSCSWRFYSLNIVWLFDILLSIIHSFRFLVGRPFAFPWPRMSYWIWARTWTCPTCIPMWDMPL